MKPVTVQAEVELPREEVFDFLDVMANHEPFTDHMMSHWKYSGPDRGVGSRARVTVGAAGRREAVDIEVVSASRPEVIVEENVAKGGRRTANGTYTLESLPGGGTRICFAYSWKRAPLGERLAAPLVRAYVRRGTTRAMRRLEEQLAARPTGSSAAGAA